MSGARGYGVAAGLDPDVATPLAARCEELGYTSMWANDHPAASGLETLAAFADGSAAMQLGVGVLAIDRHQPVTINEKIEELGLDRSRLLIGVGAGFSEKPLTAMREAHDALREAIPGVKLVLAAMGPKMCALAGSSYDGAFFNWVTPEYAADARGNVEAGAAEAGRPAPRVYGYPTPRRGSPRRRASTATSTTATAASSSASANRRAPSASPPRTPTTPTECSTPTRPSTRSSSAAWPAPSWRRWTGWRRQRRPDNSGEILRFASGLPGPTLKPRVVHLSGRAALLDHSTCGSGHPGRSGRRGGALSPAAPKGMP